jgi:hypothetical protein
MQLCLMRACCPVNPAFFVTLEAAKLPITATSSYCRNSSLFPPKPKYALVQRQDGVLETWVCREDALCLPLIYRAAFDTTPGREKAT